MCSTCHMPHGDHAIKPVATPHPTTYAVCRIAVQHMPAHAPWRPCDRTSHPTPPSVPPVSPSEKMKPPVGQNFPLRRVGERPQVARLPYRLVGNAVRTEPPPRRPVLVGVALRRRVRAFGRSWRQQGKKWDGNGLYV